MSLRFLFLCILLLHYTNALKCYDCTNCSYPWSSFTTETHGSIFSIFSRVKSCYKKEFYSAMDRRLYRVARGALDRECQAGKLETIGERSITYCCYSSYCNGTLSKGLIKHAIINLIFLSILVMLVFE